MKRIHIISLMLVSVFHSQLSFGKNNVVEHEKIYEALVDSLNFPGIFVDLAIDRFGSSSEIDNQLVAIEVFQDVPENVNYKILDTFRTFWGAVNIQKFGLEESLKISFLTNRFGVKDEKALELVAQLGTIFKKVSELGKSLESIIYSNQDKFRDIFGSALLNQIKRRTSFARYESITRNFRVKTKREIQDLVSFRSQRIRNVPSLYMFCRHDRDYPCRLIIKDREQNLVENSDGSLWSQASLAQSKHGLPFNVRNGYTPSGVYTIDSVMPEANRQRDFGKFRRAILNFIPESLSEQKIKTFLPRSAHSKNWWRESVIARDVGRNLLRIHGTGNRDGDNQSSYYPFVRTSGCISQKEGEYPEAAYFDQRTILDQMMIAAGLNPVFENEARISALLHVIEIDERPGAVQISNILNLLDRQH